MRKEYRNFLLNVAYQILTYVFPLVTIPYISRVLGVDSIGIYSYTYSIAYLFMLMGMLGFSNYGNRSISKVRDNVDELSRVFLSIYGLQLVTSLTALVGYVGYLFLFDPDFRSVGLLQALFVLSVCFDITWFFFGLEKFKITILRSLLVRVLSLILIFLLVKTPDDLWIYTLIMAGSALFSQLILFLLLPGLIRFVRISISEIRRHLGGVLVLFVPVLAFGIYRVLDKTMIGAMASVNQLGNFENAERIVSIPTAIIIALGTVMLPRMSYLLRDEGLDYRPVIFDSMKLALMLATAMSTGLILIAEDASLVLFGPEFEISGGIIQALALTLIPSAWANVVRSQFLIPKAEDSIYVKSTVGAALINFLLNLLLIPILGAYGACIGTIAAEMLIMVYQSVATRHVLENGKYLKILIVSLVKAAAMVLIAYFVSFNISGVVARLITQISVAFVAFVLLNYRYLVHEFFGR